MKTLRLAYLLCTPLLALTACPMDDDDSGPTADSTSSSTTDASSTSSEDPTTTTTTTNAETTAAPGSSSSESGDDSSSESTGDGSSSTTGSATYTISGTVRRLPEAAPLPSEDGIGTLYAIAFTECTFDAEVAGVVVIPNADLASEDNSVDFSSEGYAEGTVHFALFLDDNLDADQANPLPGPGDLVYTAGMPLDGVLSCIEVEVDGQDVDDAELILDFTRPAE